MSKKVCLSAETSPKIKGGTERLTIDERRVPELEVRRNCNTEHLPQAGGGCCCYAALFSPRFKSQSSIVVPMSKFLKCS